MLEKQAHPDYTFFKKPEFAAKVKSDTAFENNVKKVVTSISALVLASILYMGFHDYNKMEEIKDYLNHTIEQQQTNFAAQSKANAFVVSTYLPCTNGPAVSSPSIYVQKESKLTCQVNTITIARMEYGEEFSKEVLASLQAWQNPPDKAEEDKKFNQLINELYTYKMFR